MTTRPMPLVKCAECGREISYSAKACPGCGAKPPKRPMSRSTKALLGLLGVAIVGGIVASHVAEQLEADRLAALSPAERSAVDRNKNAAAARSALALTAAQAIKKAAKNPASITFSTLRVNDAGTVACAEYRGTNSFNAVVPQFTVFVNGKGSTDDAKAWNTHCTKGMHDLMLVVR